MNRCDKCITEILQYLNGTLNAGELAEFRTHVAECTNCLQRIEEELALSSIVQETKPLYLAPPSLRARVIALTEEASAKKRLSAQPRTTFGRPVAGSMSHFFRPRRTWKILAATLLFMLTLTFARNTVRLWQAADYVEAATEIHQGYIDGSIPLECRSRSSEVITAWFTGKTSFGFHLPTPQSGSNGRAQYWLAGARLVTYKHRPAAFVAYETQTEKISLLIVPSGSAAVVGGETVRSGRLSFHYRLHAGFQVITWTNHELAYALVSSSLGSAQHSCLVCHESLTDHIAVELPKDRDFVSFCRGSLRCKTPSRQTQPEQPVQNEIISEGLAQQKTSPQP